MRIFYTFFTTMCFFLTIAHTQTLNLVQDLNEGNGDAINEFNYKSVQHGDDIFFSASNGTGGYEPYVLKNGSLELLLDISTGMESSSPTEFTIFNNKVYFTAYDPINGGALWSTDGTSAGTVLAFDPSANNSTARPKGLTVAKNGALYFSYENKLYKSFGTTATTNIVPGGETVDFSENWAYQGVNYTPYEDGVAFISEDNKILKLWYADDSIIKLGEVACESFFYDYYGINQVKDGLVFGARSSFDPAFGGLYHYSPTGDSLHKLPINGNLDAEIGRIFKLNEDRVIVVAWGTGFISVDGMAANNQVVSTNLPNYLGQGTPLFHAIVGEWAVFLEKEVFSSGQNILATNGFSNSSSIIAMPQTYIISNFISYGNFALWASGISNGFTPQIWYANPANGTSGKLYEHPQGSFSLNSIIMLGVQDNKLYFFSNIDANLGRELYYLPLNLTPAKEKKEMESYSITNKGREILVSAPDPNLELNVNVFDAAGRLITNKTVQSNGSFSLDGVNGVFYIEAQAGNLRFSNRVFISN